VPTTTAASILLAGVFWLCAPAFGAADCTDFKWDVSKERALFAGPAAAMPGGADAKSAPIIVPNRLYRLQLVPQSRVRFAAAPGKKSPASGDYAGLARLKIAESGSYRVAIDAQFWIDVVSNRALQAATDFQGQHGCSAPQKIVVFDFVATQPLILQFSSATMDRIRVTITRSPARTL
jgi:hypothetical protein